MLDVGQGDSLLIQAPNGHQMLIDGGPDASVLTELSKVMPAGDNRIDVVIATHPDSDHIAGLPLVMGRYHVGLFLTSQVQGSSAIYKTLRKTIAQQRIPSYFARHGMVITLDPEKNVAFSVLFPDRDTWHWETNTASVVGRLSVAPFSGAGSGASMLFTGDSPAPVEHMLAQALPQDVAVDVLKLGHHGSKTASSEEYLRTASPQLALISAGIANKYGHPHKEVLDRLKALGIPWVSTQDKGTVELVSRAGGWNVAPTQ